MRMYFSSYTLAALIAVAAVYADETPKPKETLIEQPAKDPSKETAPSPAPPVTPAPQNVDFSAPLPAKALFDGYAIIDPAYRTRAEQVGAALRDAGKLPPHSKLREKLGRGEKVKVATLEARTAEPEGRNIYQFARPSVLIVASMYKCDKCQKLHAGDASGFAITKDTFVTNFHVVDSKRDLGMVVVDFEGRAWAVTEVLASDKRSDVAICRAEGAEFRPIAPGKPAMVGDPVWALSHPDGRFYTLTTGEVTRYSKRGRGDAQWMEIDADFARGSSGGPILDRFGNVVAMVASTNSIYYNEEGGEQKNLQMVVKTCVPVENILKLIDKGGD